MDQHHFQPGDRVRLRQPLLWVAGGSCGTIILVYLWAHDWYDVRFEPERRICPVYGADLELLAPYGDSTPGGDIGATMPEPG